MGEVIKFTKCPICLHLRKLLQDPSYQCADCDKRWIEQYEARRRKESWFVPESKAALLLLAILAVLFLWRLTE